MRDPAKVWAQLARQDEEGERYLAGRGLSGAVKLDLVRFNTGETDDGWVNEKGDQGYRVAVPLYGRDGQIATLQLRSVVDGADPAKLSLPGGYPPGGVAMGTVEEASTAPRVYLTEGIADRLSLRLAGVVTIGAPGAGELSKLPGFLGEVRGREVVLCVQNEDTSREAFAKVAFELRRLGATVLMLRTPKPYKDPAAWLEGVGPKVFKRAVRKVVAADESDFAEPANGKAQEAEPRPEQPLVLNDANIARARAYLAKIPGAVDRKNGGGGGELQTWRAVLAMVRGFALGVEVGLKLILEDYNPRCVPQWKEKDLRRKAVEAFEKDEEVGIPAERAAGR